jgi:hypothetical protein
VHLAKSYMDYSHGVRMVSKLMIADDQVMRVEEVIRDKDLFGLVAAVHKPNYPIRYPGL